MLWAIQRDVRLWSPIFFFLEIQGLPKVCWESSHQWNTVSQIFSNHTTLVPLPPFHSDQVFSYPFCCQTAPRSTWQQPASHGSSQSLSQYNMKFRRLSHQFYQSFIWKSTKSNPNRPNASPNHSKRPLVSHCSEHLQPLRQTQPPSLPCLRRGKEKKNMAWASLDRKNGRIHHSEWQKKCKTNHVVWVSECNRMGESGSLFNQNFTCQRNCSFNSSVTWLMTLLKISKAANPSKSWVSFPSLHPSNPKIHLSTCCPPKGTSNAKASHPWSLLARIQHQRLPLIEDLMLWKLATYFFVELLGKSGKAAPEFGESIETWRPFDAKIWGYQLKLSPRRGIQRHLHKHGPWMLKLWHPLTYPKLVGFLFMFS